MNNHNYKSFLRSIYYKGKLLQADDFIREQQYIKNKLKMMNLMNQRSGVIEGLGFEKVGKDELLLHPGIAMDVDGNIIVVPDKRVLKLPKFKGYKKEDYSRNMYACLSFHERKIYNKEINKAEKMEETYRLGVVSELEAFNEKIQLHVVYESDGIKIYIQLPTEGYSNGKIKGKIFIDKPKGKKVSIAMKGKLQGILTMDHRDRTTFDCYAQEDELFAQKSFNYRIIAGFEEEAKFFIEDLIVKIDEDEEKDEDSKTFQVEVVEQTGIMHQDKMLGPIYLGRIGVKCEEGQEFIDEVEYLPFGQHVLLEDEKISVAHKRPLNTKANILPLLANEEPRADARYDESKNEILFTFGLPKVENVENSSYKIKTGIIRIDLGQGGKAGRCYASEYIHHGLGVGPVSLQYAVEEKMVRLSGLPEPEEQLMFGDFDVFSETDVVTTVPAHKIGAVLYPKEGRFKLGLKLMGPTKLKTIVLRWWATKITEDIAVNALEDEDNVPIKISIKPSKIELKKGQKIQLKAMVENANNTNVTWRILDIDGGKISQKGFYTAPNVRGVYKIEATSVADFSQTATVIVVVRD